MRGEIQMLEACKIDKGLVDRVNLEIPCKWLDRRHDAPLHIAIERIVG